MLSLNNNNSNNASNDTNDSDSSDDDIPLVQLGKKKKSRKSSPLCFQPNMIHPYKDRNHYPRDPDSNLSKYPFGAPSTHIQQNSNSKGQGEELRQWHETSPPWKEMFNSHGFLHPPALYSL